MGWWMPNQFLTYTELADRIHQVLGVRPAPATLRAASATSTRPGRGAGLTVGMPAPVPLRDVAGRVQFDPTEIEAWLQHHPQLVRRRRQQALTAAPRAARAAAVDTARTAGLSWQEIAEACGAADHTSYTRQWAQQRYGRPKPSTSASS